MSAKLFLARSTWRRDGRSDHHALAHAGIGARRDRFLLLFYQWNAAAKAVQIGARLAAVSDPVASGLNGLSQAVVGASVPPGAAMPKFIVTCDGRTATCTCNGSAPAGGLRSYDGAAMNTIVFGRGSSSCSDAKSGDGVGMCDIFSRITPTNVKIVYAQTGLGYAGRPGGPTPTITVSLQNLPFQFFFLRGLMGFHDLQIPASTVSTDRGGSVLSCAVVLTASPISHGSTSLIHVIAAEEGRQVVDGVVQCDLRKLGRATRPALAADLVIAAEEGRQVVDGVVQCDLRKLGEATPAAALAAQAGCFSARPSAPD